MAVNDKTFQWDYDAARVLLLKSDEIAEVCEEAAAKMTRATGMEYKPDVRMGQKRVRAMAQGDIDGATVKRKRRFRKNDGEKFPRDPETDWPICPKCGEAHYHCTCYRKKG